ncbi:MAG TPA: glycosyltransferase [Patescibacteria group bacterium]|nr:glycosyltransferase [Patescibacteria group bacterium]
MFVYDDVTHDTRVRREAVSLAADGHEVTIVGRPTDLNAATIEEDRLDGIRVLRVPIPAGWRRPWRLFGAPLRAVARAWARLRGRPNGGRTLSWLVVWRFGTAGWARRAAAAAPPAAVVHGHDLSGLLAAAAVARRDGIPVIYDSHELFVEAGAVANLPHWARSGLVRTEARLIRSAAAVITVNGAIADELVARYTVAHPVVVHNCPPRPTGTPDRSRLRSALGLAPGTPVVLCHGGLIVDRGIEQTAEALLEPDLEAAHLVFLGRRTLMIEPILATPALAGRVHLLPAVAPDEVVEWVAGADVASMPIQPTSLNHRLSTPNKLFESLSAGVPVVSSDFPVRRAIVIDDPDGPLGAVCDPSSAAAIACAIRSILSLSEPELVDLRERCLKAARERWNWETESRRLVDVYRRLAGAS